MTAPRRVAAVMTVFNRKEATLRCLQSLGAQGVPNVDLTTFVVDDASPDGTAEAITAVFPDTRLIRGDGDLYWNGGMRLAMAAALAEDFDFYWWLNDDVELDPDALSRLLETSDLIAEREREPGIIVGSVRDPAEGHVTYGGVVRNAALRPLRFELVRPSPHPVRASTMNGNCVLVPGEVARKVGNLSPEYRQKMGDFDYGLRAREIGIEVWVAPGTYGTCATHPPRRTTDLPLLDEVRRLWSVKELPFKSWATFTRRWSGPLWPLFFVSPYLRRGLRLLVDRIRR